MVVILSGEPASRSEAVSESKDLERHGLPGVGMLRLSRRAKRGSFAQHDRRFMDPR
jgi:hypothetical protein